MMRRITHDDSQPLLFYEAEYCHEGLSVDKCVDENTTKTDVMIVKGIDDYNDLRDLYAQRTGQS